MDSIRFGTFIPSRRSSALSDQFMAFPEHANYFWESLDDIKPVPSPANFAEMSEIFMRHMGDIMANIATPEQGLEAAHTRNDRRYGPPGRADGFVSRLATR